VGRNRQFRSLDDRQDVGHLDDELLLAFHLDRGAGVLVVDHAVLGLHLDGLVVADREDHAFLGLLLRSLGNVDASSCLRLHLHHFDQHAVTQRLNFHSLVPPESVLFCFPIFKRIHGRI
jgi:hypothetical protein